MTRTLATIGKLLGQSAIKHHHCFGRDAAIFRQPKAEAIHPGAPSQVRGALSRGDNRIGKSRPVHM